jgi:transcriptional regulator with XRE-family HTH domain
MPSVDDRFAEVLSELQRARGLSDSELADLLEIGTRQLNNWRAGRARPPWNRAVRLARKLGMEPSDFMGLERTNA